DGKAAGLPATRLGAVAVDGAGPPVRRIDDPLSPAAVSDHTTWRRFLCGVATSQLPLSTRCSVRRVPTRHNRTSNTATSTTAMINTAALPTRVRDTCSKVHGRDHTPTPTLRRAAPRAQTAAPPGPGSRRPVSSRPPALEGDRSLTRQAALTAPTGLAADRVSRNVSEPASG